MSCVLLMPHLFLASTQKQSVSTSVSTTACLGPSWWDSSPPPPALLLQAPASSPTKSLPPPTCANDFIQGYFCYSIILETDLGKGLWVKNDGTSGISSCKLCIRHFVFLLPSPFFYKCHGVLLKVPIYLNRFFITHIEF